MNTRYSGGYVRATVAASLSVAILLGAIGFQLGTWRAEHAPPLPVFERPSEESHIIFGERDWKKELIALGLIPDIATTSSSEPPVDRFEDAVAYELLRGYQSLKNLNAYTPAKGSELGFSVARSIRTPLERVAYTEKDIVTSSDTSKEAVLRYRGDMRIALESIAPPTEPEIETFARYIETKNPGELIRIQDAAERHKKAEGAMKLVAAPEDARAIHLRALNALGVYTHTLDALAEFADNTFTVVVLLRTYNEAERELLYAFDALADYYVRKTL